MKAHKTTDTQLPAKRTLTHFDTRRQASIGPDKATVVVVRTDKRSWLALAITGFGAFLLRYVRTVRERGKILRLRK